VKLAVFTGGRRYFYIALSRDTPTGVLVSWQPTLDQLKQESTRETIHRAYLPDAELGDLLDRQ